MCIGIKLAARFPRCNTGHSGDGPLVTRDLVHEDVAQRARFQTEGILFLRAAKGQVSQFIVVLSAILYLVSKAAMA